MGGIDQVEETFVNSHVHGGHGGVDKLEQVVQRGAEVDVALCLNGAAQTQKKART